MNINYNLPNNFPRQKLPRSQKDEEWGRQNLDFIISLTSFSSLGARGSGRGNFQRMKVNYDLYNNIFDKEDFKYVTEPYGVDYEFPAKLENYNIITPKLKLLEGEEIKRPFNFRVVATNADAVSEIQAKRKELLMQHLEAELERSLVEQGVNVQNPQAQDTMTPPEIEKYMNYSEADIRELTANKIAYYLQHKENLEFKFNKGFKDALIAATEVYYTGISDGEPICEVVNPLDFDFDKNPDLDYIQDSQWAAHTKYCTPGEVIDLYYDDLSEEEVDQLDTGRLYNGALSRLPEGPASGPIVPVTYTRPAFDNNMRSGFIRVTRIEWKSLRKIGFLKYFDDDLQEQEKVVDESYNIVKENGETIEWAWINEVWEGTKIGDGIYIRIKPKTVQYRSIDNPSLCKLGYVGTIYNDRNSIPTSIIDLVKHHQYLYNIIMYKMELEIAKAKGKKMIMDIAQIPRSQGIDMQKWLYYFDTIGIGFINSFEEGKGKFSGQVSQFNQFSNIDMTLSESIGQYINILSKIEEMASDLMGVTKQRQGSISSTETVGGVERSVMQSSNITEPLFYIHNELKKCVLTQLIECAKVAYPEGKKINYILDNAQRIFLTITDKFSNADYGVFVTNSSKEVKALEDLKALANQAISSGMITLKEAVTIIQSQSLAEVKQIVIAAEQKADQDKQSEQQQEQSMQQQQIQATQQTAQEHEDREDKRLAMKLDAEKEMTYIKTFGGVNASPEDDANGDGTPDVLEYKKLEQEMIMHKDKVNLENKKMVNDKQIATDKLAVEKIKARKPTGGSK